MAKKSSKEDPIERANRKLEKARLKLEAAEERYAQARTRGKQEIERARLQAAEWLAEAAERVQRRQAAVERAEARLRDATEPPEESSDLAPLTVGEILLGPVESDAMNGEGGVALPAGLESAEVILVEANGATALTARDLQALHALRDVQREGGVTAQDWRASAGMTGTTFGRARTTLVAEGLVAQDSDPGRSTRYTLTGAGLSLVSEARDSE